MNKSELRSLLLHQFASQSDQIEAFLEHAPEEIEESAAVLNEFRQQDPSLQYSAHQYTGVKTRPGPLP